MKYLLISGYVIFGLLCILSLGTLKATSAEVAVSKCDSYKYIYETSCYETFLKASDLGLIDCKFQSDKCRDLRKHCEVSAIKRTREIISDCKGY